MVHTMTMHLTHFTTTGKRKGKFKYASAEAKRVAEQLEQDWQKLKQKYVTSPKTGSTVTKKCKLVIPKGRDTSHIKSLSNGVGTATKADIPMYTGTKMIGIGVLHKSNAVPVFSDEEAVEISKMRRG